MIGEEEPSRKTLHVSSSWMNFWTQITDVFQVAGRIRRFVFWFDLLSSRSDTWLGRGRAWRVSSRFTLRASGFGPRGPFSVLGGGWRGLIDNTQQLWAEGVGGRVGGERAGWKGTWLWQPSWSGRLLQNSRLESDEDSAASEEMTWETSGHNC